MAPLVSILMPVYNRKDFIEDAVKCAINQTYQNIEIIICDNASTDGTWDILEKYAQKDSRIKLFRNEENVGIMMNFGRCIDKASGKYGIFILSDDLTSETFIEHTLPLIDDDTAFVFSGTRLFFTDPQVAFKESSFQNRDEYSVQEYLEDVLIYLKIGFPVSPGCALFRIEDLKTSFTPDVPNDDNLVFRNFGACDLLFYLITATRYTKVRTLNKVEAFFRCHGDSITMQNIEKVNIYYAWAKYYFVNNYRKDLLSKFKARLFVLKLYKKGYDNVYAAIKAIPSFSCCLYLIFDTIKTKVLSYRS